jgi:diguanylate cyclase (GGDEF)-like protein/PAS domain S-box-containing protein
MPSGLRTGPANAWQRTRPLVIFFVLTTCVLGVALAAVARTLIASFAQVEATAVSQKTLQVYRAFEADLRQLAISNRDYAEWDDAAEFVRTGDSKFIAANFVRETLTGMHVDVVWIVDRDGREIYSCFTDRSAAPVVSPAPRAYLQGLRPFLGNYEELRRRPPAERIVNTEHGLAAVSALEIKRTDRTEPTGATMLFARFIEQDDVERVREATQLPITMIYLAAGVDPVGIPTSVQAWLRSTDISSNVLVLPDDEHQITGYALVRTIEHVPVALFATHSAREIYALGRRTTWSMVSGIAALFVSLGAAVTILMLRLRRSFAARHSLETRYRNIGAQLPEAIVLIDASSFTIVEANDAAIRALGCDRKHLHARAVQDIFPDVTMAVLSEAAAAQQARTICPSRARREDGGWADTEVAITSMDVDAQRLLTLVAHDISHRREAEKRERVNRRRLMELAQHDALTGLPNRLYLHSKLPKVLSKLKDADRLLALVYMDVDHFKNVNDSRGHGCGDQLLQIVARRMRAALSAQDLVVRMGGDEFVIVASLLSDMQAIEDLVVRLRTAVSAPIVLEGQPMTVTASLGIAIYPGDGIDVNTLLKHADIALYQAKEAGRDCHRFFAADMDLRVIEHVALEQSLRHAVGSKQIFMEYQPIIDLKTGRVASLEALMRWRHPDRGVIPPSQFIPVAEKSGLIVELGRQALVQVIAQIRAWLDADVPIVPVAVNVSPLQFDRTDFAALVATLSNQAGVDPRWLRFEITESAVLKEPEKLIGTLQTLRALGSKVLIDDFGTGYSSLSYLNRLPVDILKIDRTFVRDLGKETVRTPIIGTVIELAKRLGMTTVAEGVETAEQAEMLREQGCDFGQGFHYSKPVAARHCSSLLRELSLVRKLTETMVVRAIASG